jgi:hypothetical protein
MPSLSLFLSSLAAYLREQDTTPLSGLQQSRGGGILGVDFSKLVSDCRVLGSRHEHGKGRDIPAVLQEVTLSRPIQPDVKTFCSEGYPKGPFCFVFVRSFSTDLRKY